MPYLFDIKGVMKQLQTKKGISLQICHLTLTEKWWLDSMELSSDAGLCVCTPYQPRDGWL